MILTLLSNSRCHRFAGIPTLKNGNTVERTISGTISRGERMRGIGFAKPNYPHERRVALLPKHLSAYKEFIAYDSIYIETTFGEHLDISDAQYQAAACRIVSREEIFSLSTVFSLKLIQPSDYLLLRQGQQIIGWMHPNGSGREVFHGIARKKSITIFDIDSVYPRIYRHDGSTVDVVGLPKHFFWKNSYIAGMASTQLALTRQISSLRQIDRLRC